MGLIENYLASKIEPLEVARRTAEIFLDESKCYGYEEAFRRAKAEYENIKLQKEEKNEYR